MKKKKYIMSKKYVIYEKKNVLVIKNIKRLEIIGIALENIKELLMIFAIYDTNHQKKFVKILQMMLKKDLIHQLMKSMDHCLQERITK